MHVSPGRLWQQQLKILGWFCERMRDSAVSEESIVRFVGITTDHFKHMCWAADFIWSMECRQQEINAGDRYSLKHLPGLFEKASKSYQDAAESRQKCIDEFPELFRALEDSLKSNGLAFGQYFQLPKDAGSARGIGYDRVNKRRLL